MEDLIIGVLLALFLIIPCWLALSRRDEVQKQVDVWPEFPSANQDFDRHFSVIGSPHQYVQEAVDLIVRSDQHLLAWIMRSFPSIELKGENLFCSQNSELTNSDDQMALLTLLCDLAELTEKMERDNADHDNEISNPDSRRLK